MRKLYGVDTQFLTVAYAKDVGLDAQGRVEMLDPGASNLEEAGLEPLLVYCAVVPALSCYARRLVSADKPEPLSAFLADAWSQKSGLGMPARLEVKPALMQGDAPIGKWLAGQGVELAVAPSLRGIDAFERQSLQLCSAVAWGKEGDSDVMPKQLPRDLGDCNAGLSWYDRSVSQPRYAGEWERFQAWKREARRFCCEQTVADDWDPSRIVAKVARRPKPYLAVTEESGDAVSIEGIKELVTMWPGGAKRFFEATRVAKSDFDFWVAGRAHLDKRDFAAIRDIAAIQYLDEYDDWELGGGYLLDSTRASPAAVERLYDALSHGGDLRVAFEVLSPEGERGDMRFVLLASCGGMTNIMLFERGGKCERLLDGGRLINLEEAECATHEVWETVVDIIARRDEFREPGKVGIWFERQHLEWMESKERM